LPRNLRFVPADLEAQTLAGALRGAGCDPGQRTFFSWLGVTPYLRAEAVMATLRFIAAAPAGSAVVFDYLISPLLLNAAERSAFDSLARRVASAGEPWQAFFDPAALKSDVRTMGFRHVTDMGPAEINARYFNERKDGLRAGSLAHLMKARV
ncbi:MAG: class I SAM-dependent methyltransferase, partial [Hyphomicrobiales bacterium]